MASFTLLRSGAWRVQVRRKGAYVAETFLRKTDAQDWAREAELAIDRGLKSPRRGQPAPKKGQTTLGHLIDLHIADMNDVGRELARSKKFVLATLKDRLGRLSFEALTRERLVEYGRERAREGAGPATLAIDFAYLNTIITHAAAVHGVLVSVEQVKLARAALVRLGLIGKADERDRRPTEDELDHLTAFLDGNPKQRLPVGRIVRFAVATAMRVEEITRIRWNDIDERKRTVIVRDRKDPRHKDGNHQPVPLLAATGYDAWALLKEQGAITGHLDRIFPYDPRSIGAAFRRACRELEVEDLRFHDLRHEGTSRLFEAGFTIEQVSLVTGHKDWKMLRRYTNLRPEKLHDTARELRERAAENAKRRAGQSHQKRRTDILAEELDADDEQDSLRVGRSAKLRERVRNSALSEEPGRDMRSKRKRSDR
jgi:integrase